MQRRVKSEFYIVDIRFSLSVGGVPVLEASVEAQRSFSACGELFLLYKRKFMGRWSAVAYNSGHLSGWKRHREGRAQKSLDDVERGGMSGTFNWIKVFGPSGGHFFLYFPDNVLCD